MSAPDLSALVSARFCHDLISPLGAIGNGLELLQMTGSGSPEVDLISDSLTNALAKVRFFRVAFGPADPETRVTMEEAGEITGAMFNGRLTVAWMDLDASLPRPVARLAFLAILCLEKSLPMGGLVRVSTAEDTVSMHVESRRIGAPAELWAHVTDGAEIPELRSDCVQFPALREALLSTGHGLEAQFGEADAELSLTPRAQEHAA
ncbi:histidine phosphotransferase family protein [Amaricoccus macauensis]|uniref:histidine phosphotransferase family protein n=1 Tax=Amaricoccus macauensis TaxID=57001 RepID=UPI003C79ECD1